MQSPVVSQANVGVEHNAESYWLLAIGDSEIPASRFCEYLSTTDYLLPRKSLFLVNNKL